MKLLQDYKNLHTVPELDTRLPKTLSYIENALSSLSCTITTPTEGSVCAFFDFGWDRALAFRADTDALPIEEATGLSYASQHRGIMHACGHDGHTAILLELARRLETHTPLPHNILLIFQPAEETGGGALSLCKTGLLQQYNVVGIFGLHLWPGLPYGKLFSKPGALMACSSEIRVQFFGKSCHIAQDPTSGDALAACCRFYTRAQKAVKKESVLMKFCRSEGGAAPNILCDKASLWGTVRGESQQALSGVQRRLRGICKWAAYSHGCSGEIRFSQGYPPIHNCPALYGLAQQISPCKQLRRSFFTTDDFSEYSQRVPGVYYLLGIGNTPPLHSADFAFDPDVLRFGADHLEKLACHIPSAAITIRPRLSR